MWVQEQVKAKLLEPVYCILTFEHRRKKMSNQIIEDAEKSINSYQSKTGTARQSDSGEFHR